MSDKAFFDTNVLVYVVAQKNKRTEMTKALLAAGGVISVLVLNELASVSRKKRGIRGTKLAWRSRRFARYARRQCR